ncbi:MAG TPA: hypothetical protein VHA37_07780 [Candidatus Saccharimonadales bacterium]|nr:hypothetical protein [Candidatus Saccharimonadales bacterium]
MTTIDISDGEQLRQTAIHEAGHAVTGRVLSLPCGQVTIEADHDSAGHSIIVDPWEIVAAWDQQGIYHRGYDEAMRARIMTYMAGSMAEEECLGACHDGDGDDQMQVDLMLDSLLPAGVALEPYAARLKLRLRGIIRRHKASIEHLAAQLLERGTLSPMEVEQILGCG